MKNHIKQVNIHNWLRTHKKQRPIAFLLAFGFIGSLVIAFSQAAVVTSNVEPEANSSILTGCASRLYDPTASAEGAIKFGSFTGGELGLDSCGRTIPSHDYAPPSTGRVIYMSPKGADKDSDSVDGNDANSGTSISAPVETITAAYNKLKSNNTTGSGTIVLRGGKYRSWHSTDGGKTAGFMTGLNITFQAYQKENPWFVGTDVVPKTSWESTGNNIWRQRWETPHFCKSHLNAGQTFEGQEYGYRTKIPGLVPGSRVAPITSGRGNKHTPYDSTSGIAMTYFNSSLNRNVDTPRICAHPDAYYINPNRPVDVDSDPQMVFANDIELPQRKTLAELSTKPDSFYYDWNNQYVYVNKDPTSNTLEITRRHAIVNLSGGHSFQWKGIGVKRFASSPLHGVIYAGLGSGVATGEIIVEKSVFSENSGATLDVSGPKNNSAIKNSVFARNKYAGFGSNGFAAKADPNIKNKLLIDSTIFNENNWGLHDTECGASCGVAGVKLNNMVGFTVKNSIFENTKGRNAPGLWCDIDCSGGVMVNNIMRNNTGPGIFYEISSQGIIAGNLVYYNDFANIKVLAASTKVYNNTIINKVGPNVEAVWISDDNRPAPEDPAIWPNEKWPFSVAAMQDAHARLGVGYAVRVGPNTRGVEFVNNLVVSQPVKGARLMNFMNSGVPKSPNTNSPDYFTAMSHNIYYRASSEQPLYGWLSNGDIRSITEFQNTSKQGWEQNTIDIVGTGDPFESRANQDFRVKISSQAFEQKGRLLPTDVAAALGLSSTQAYQRGAINWPR